jgi:hypothetical protein
VAGILHEFVQNTKILASQVNENFATVQNDMTELGSGINANLTNEITKAKSDLLTDIQNVSNNKASLDLANINSNGKANVIDWMAPNRGAGYSIASGWTAPKAGWINARHNQSHDNQYFTLWVDGVAAFETGGGGSYSAGDTDNIELFVNKGSKVTFDGSGNIRVTFSPCKGV